jgi:dTDP-4-amino-4,6-dideoxygalactose transaminase
MADAARRGHLSGDGHYTRLCHKLLRDLTGAHEVLLTTSCTHALEISASLIDFAPGDEIILPSFTFVSTANAFVLRGARPVFVDIRPDTLNIDESLIEAAITPRTRAIAVVHYAGIACEMDRIMEIAARHKLTLIEDNAHGLGGTYRGRSLGTFGQLATQSFHETKNIHCGEGGALLINSPDLTERSEILREKGTDRSRFFRGQVDKYTWVDVGSSYLPSDLLAAFLLAQLESFVQIHARRMEIWSSYDEGLRDWADQSGVQLPTVPAHSTHPAHLYFLLLPDQARRDAFIAHLRERSVHAVFHYVPLHNSPKGLALGGGEANCPVTERVSDRLVRLPIFPDLDPSDLDRIIAAVRSFEVV